MAHPPRVERVEARAGARHLLGDSIAEEQREERLDLVLASDLDQPERRVIRCACAGTRDPLVVGRNEEVLRVLDADAERRGTTAQEVETLDARAGIRRRIRGPGRGRQAGSALRDSPRW